MLNVMNKDLGYANQLISYIKKNLKKGYTKESLKWALVSQGHSGLEIERAFQKAEGEMAREAPILKTKPKITYEIVEPKLEDIKVEKEPFWKKWFG